MATKIGIVVEYNEELPIVKLHDLSISWFCEVIWKIKYFVFPLVRDQWPPNMVRG